MERTYQRSKILSYADLTPEQRDIAEQDCDNCDDTQFVLWSNEPISLENFVWLKSKLWNGAFAVSAFSGYYLRLNHDNSEATVVYAHW